MDGVARPAEGERAAVTGRLGRHFPWNNLLLGGAWLICAAVGAVGAQSRWLSIALFGIICLSWTRDEFYLFLAIFVFFMEQFYLSASTPLFRLYSYMAIVRLMLDIPKARFRLFFLPPLLVFCLFSLLGVGALNLRAGINLAVDVLVAYCVLVRVLADSALARKFFAMLALIGVAAGIYSLLAGNAVTYEVGRQYVRSEGIIRYRATYDDANYAGFFYLICIHAVLNLTLFQKPYVRIPLLLVLNIFLLLTNSITALMVLVLSLSFYILVRFPRKALAINLIAFSALAALVALILTVPALSEIGFIKNVVIRVREQIRYLQAGRLDMFTSDRTYIWTYFWNYFNSQSVLGRLFGGNVVTSMLVDEKFALYKACHQVYLQGLITFGILGAAVVFFTVLARFAHRVVRHLNNWRRDGCADLTRFALTVTLIWLSFGLSLDFLLDWRFMFFYFL